MKITSLIQKLFPTILLFIVTYNTSAQDYGIMQGAAYKHDFYRALEMERQGESLRRERVQLNYLKLQNIYNYKPSYAAVLDGWHKVVATDATKFMESRSVYVSGGVVTVYKNGEGISMTIQNGGRVVDEKTIIHLKENDSLLELYFGITLN